MTVRLAISVEGLTEHEFCKELIRPHLEVYGVVAETKIIVTKRNIAGPDAKGGSVSVERVIAEVKPLLHTFDHVTTFYDYYGFKGRQPGESPEALCHRLADGLKNPSNFWPYLQVHEFEALLFASPEAVANYLAQPPMAKPMAEAVASCGSAEQINDRPEMTPSKRMKSLFAKHVGQSYDKKFHGPLLLMEIGLPAIRLACPRFDRWLTQLEQLDGIV